MSKLKRRDSGGERLVADIARREQELAETFDRIQPGMAKRYGVTAKSDALLDGHSTVVAGWHMPKWVKAQHDINYRVFPDGSYLPTRDPR